MDFVVLGFGIGALAVLLGLGLRDLGPLARRIARDGDLDWSEVGGRVRWGRTCRALGLVLALGGAAISLATLVTLVSGAGDGTGMRLVLVWTLVVALGVGAWATLYFRADAGRRLSTRPVGPVPTRKRAVAPPAATRRRRADGEPKPSALPAEDEIETFDPDWVPATPVRRRERARPAVGEAAGSSRLVEQRRGETPPTGRPLPRRERG